MHAVVAVAHPAGAGPDVAVFVAADSVGHAGLGDLLFLAVLVHFLHLKIHAGKGLAILEAHAIDHVPNLDFLFGLGIVRGTGVGDVELFVIRAETQAVGFENILGHLGQLAGLGINAVDRFFLVWLHATGLGAVTLIIHQAAVARVGKPDGAVRMHHGIVGGVEGFAAVAVGEHGDLTVVLVAHYAAVAVFARNLASGPVEGVAVAVAAGMTECAHVSVLLQPAQLNIVRDIAPE